MSVTNLLWVLLVIYVLAILSGIHNFATGTYTPPTPRVRGCALALQVFFLVWIALLLFR